MTTGVIPLSGIAGGGSAAPSVSAREPSVSAVPSTDVSNASPTAVTMLIGMVALLVGLKYIGELESTAIRPSHINIGGYNLLAVGVTAMVFFAITKLLFNRFQLPGITPLVNFV